jgi:hypothetical protein
MKWVQAGRRGDIYSKKRQTGKIFFGTVNVQYFLYPYRHSASRLLSEFSENRNSGQMHEDEKYFSIF